MDRAILQLITNRIEAHRKHIRYVDPIAKFDVIGQPPFSAEIEANQHDFTRFSPN